MAIEHRQDSNAKRGGKTTTRTSFSTTMDYKVSDFDRLSFSFEESLYDSPLNQRTLTFSVGRGSHAFRGRSARNASMFLPPFHAYVYLIYGTSFCVNVTSEDEGTGAAVLVRALEPAEGLGLMEARRGTTRVRDLARGPGRLCTALGIDRTLDGTNLLAGESLWLAAGEAGVRIGSSRRIGISKAAERRLRFYEKGNPFVSGPKGLSP